MLLIFSVSRKSLNPFVHLMFPSDRMDLLSSLNHKLYSFTCCPIFLSTFTATLNFSFWSCKRAWVSIGKHTCKESNGSTSQIETSIKISRSRQFYVSRFRVLFTLPFWEWWLLFLLLFSLSLYTALNRLCTQKKMTLLRFQFVSHWFTV